jgi:Flp pilus assembly protein TadD
LSLKPNSPDGHAAFEILLLQQGHNEEAAKELGSAISIDPGLLEARKALASIHLAAGDSPSAIRVLRNAGESPELDNEARLILAEALMRNREFAPALGEVDRVLNAEPTNAPAARLKELILRQSR